jgi:hypothetical protein
MQLLSLVALTDRACSNKVAHNRVGTRDVEVGACDVVFLGAFMPDAVGTPQYGMEQW